MTVCQKERTWRPTNGMSSRAALPRCLGRAAQEGDLGQEVREAENKEDERMMIEEDRGLDLLAARQKLGRSRLARLEVKPPDLRRGKLLSSQLGLPLGMFNRLQGGNQHWQGLYLKFLGNQIHPGGLRAR